MAWRSAGVCRCACGGGGDVTPYPLVAPAPTPATDAGRDTPALGDRLPPPDCSPLCCMRKALFCSLVMPSSPGCDDCAAASSSSAAPPALAAVGWPYHRRFSYLLRMNVVRTRSSVLALILRDGGMRASQYELATLLPMRVMVETPASSQ